MPQPPRILIIAGSDPSGGAGVQGDIKTVSALGGYAMAAITALTVQNTRGVFAVHGVPAKIVAAQAQACIEDIGVDAVKIGMLGEAATVEAVADLLRTVSAPIVLDPVLAATSGDSLAADGVREAIIERLLPLAEVVTPNAPEAAALAGRPVETEDDLAAAGRLLLKEGANAALMKGGHFSGDEATDLLITPTNEMTFSGPRIETRHTHGTGCALASAIATELGRGTPLAEAVQLAGRYVRRAIETAPGLGGGAGPLGHMHTLG